MRTLIAATLALAACGNKQEEFAASYAESVCQLYVDCEVLLLLKGYESVDQCEADVGGSVDEASCPDFDKDAGEGCLTGLAAMSCDDLFNEEWPEDCDAACAGG